MAKRKSNKKSRATRQKETRVAVRTRNRKRNLILTSALAAFIVVIIGFVVLGTDSSSNSSTTSSTAVSLGEETRVEQAVPPVSTGHGPSIHFPEPEFDFGSIAQGQKVSHTFAVQNTGDEPLKLIRAKGS